MTVNEIVEILQMSPLYETLSEEEAIRLAFLIAASAFDGTVNDFETL